MRQIQHDDSHQWTTTAVVDEEAIDHERRIGITAVVNDAVLVRAAQRVDYDLLADPVTTHVHPPRITMGEVFEMNAAQARDLAGHLVAAADFIETLGADRALRRPQLVPRR